MKDDPIIAAIRKVRRRISARCGHDPKRLMEHYKKFEKKLRQSRKFRFADEMEALTAPHRSK